MLKIIKILNNLHPKLKVNHNNIGDLDFTLFPFLKKYEKTISEFGEFVKQSYFFNNEEVLFISYLKKYDTIFLEGINYKKEFIGFGKVINYINEKGEVEKKKVFGTTFFDLTPIFNKQKNSIQFNSLERDRFLKNTRNNLVDKIKLLDPCLFKRIKQAYLLELSNYIEFGDLSELIKSMEALNESDNVIRKFTDAEQAT
jgi:hypothetical protein